MMKQFKSYFFRGLGIVGGAMMSHSVLADAVLLDPATLTVGSSVGEYLVVKEACPDPVKTNCQATEKLKYVTAVAGRTGKIEFAVNLTDNFELDVNVDWTDFVLQVITLLKADNVNTSSLFIRCAEGHYIQFNDNSRSNSRFNLGWQVGNSINNVELSAKNGTAYLNINDTPFKDEGGNEGDTVALDTSQPFVKLVIAGIKEADRLFEVTLKGGTGGSTTPTTGGGDFEAGKQAGIQQCKSNPLSCGLQNTNSCQPGETSGVHATYSPTTGEVHIPFIDVPGVFGGTQSYEVYLLQRPLTFTFDLDTNRVVPKHE